MLIKNLIIGLFFIGMGFLVKSCQGMILGYNTMSEEKKKNVDIVGASAFMKKGFIILGITIIASSVFIFIDYLKVFSFLIRMVIMLAGILIIITNVQKYDRNNRKDNTLILYIFFGVVLIFLMYICVYPFVPTKAIFEEEKIQFTGSYGFDLNISDIETVELVNEIPKIKMRTNGVSVGQGYVHKGEYRLETWGTCRLLINSNNPPFLVIKKKNGEKIIISNKEKTVTENIYRQIELLKE